MDAMTMMTPRLRQLEDCLAAGWRIDDEPVLQRAAYHSAAGRICVYEVILCHVRGRSVIALADEPAVRQFLAERQVAVIDTL
jgi:hypothetical protein